MLKILLTADNHIGLKYASHEQGSFLAQARISALEPMVELAHREDCGLFVIAGDLFENVSTVSKRDVKAATEILSHFHGTVAILPGNHDYYTPEAKVWQHFREAAGQSDNLLLMTEARPYSLDIAGESVTLYPALCNTRHSAPGENSLDWIKKLDLSTASDSYRIGVAHGALEGETIDSEGRYFLMTRQELCSIPMDLWLLGHTHIPFPRNLIGNTERIFNAGTHVQTDVSCACQGQCFLLELEQDRTVRAKSVPTGSVNFVRKDVAVTAGQMEAQLERALAELDDHTVVEILLSGAVLPEEYENRHIIAEKLLSRFLEGRYYDYGLSRRISRETIEKEFPETSFAAGFLTVLLDDAKEAQLAYDLLQELKEGLQ